MFKKLRIALIFIRLYSLHKSLFLNLSCSFTHKTEAIIAQGFLFLFQAAGIEELFHFLR